MTVAISPVYELWDTETGNLIADYAEEAAALLAIRESVDDDGLAAWATVALVRVEPSGERVPIAEGTALMARALTGSEGTIDLGELTVDAGRFQEALALISLLTRPEFLAAMRDLNAVLFQSFTGVLQGLEEVRAAVLNLSRTTGVPVRVEEDGPGLALITPSEAMASLLAIGVPYSPTRRESPVRAVAGGYAVDIAA